MKRIIGLFSFMLFLGTVSMTAQENTSPVEAAVETATVETKKACSKSKKACAASCAAKAAKAASLSDDVEKSVCPMSGTVSYKRKHVCGETGKVSYNEVKFDEATASFVNLEEDTEVKAASEVRGKKKACSKTCKKTCAKGKKGA